MCTCGGAGAAAGPAVTGALFVACSTRTYPDMQSRNTWLGVESGAFQGKYESTLLAGSPTLQWKISMNLPY